MFELEFYAIIAFTELKTSFRVACCLVKERGAAAKLVSFGPVVNDKLGLSDCLKHDQQSHQMDDQEFTEPFLEFTLTDYSLFSFPSKFACLNSSNK